MTLLLKQIFAFIKLLNSDTGTDQIALGIACGLVLGFSPIISLQAAIVILVIFFFRVQMGAAFLSAFFFEIPAFLLQPFFHFIGSFVLEIGFLHPIYTFFFNIPLVPLTKFYNSVVMGAGIFSLLAAYPTYLFSSVLVRKYRRTVVEQFKNTKFWKAVQATALYKWYYRYDQLFG